ncbi:hypothetical protein C343_03746 [Cryptococcus neoformans C23]|nr:hypothetical protein C347_03808 [Cryptococcus neoformans var. grubii AD2-60a]OWZ43151.1 hypothetical protein C343_03746 [Cryptococcus neoformans var. grubii C23]OXC84232.1 hypothetical protein C344_03505 [Cryptococcus neoformans var. grubii AD1-7a]OXH31343.1 hypothetical protein J005_03596 [Cryptococcus neoformans var. grubii]
MISLTTRLDRPTKTSTFISISCCFRLPETCPAASNKHNMSRSTTPAYQLRRPALNISSAPASSTASRVGTPPSSNTAAKQVVSLDEWESKSPLSNEQIGSIGAVKTRFGERDLPEKFKNEGPSVDTPVGNHLHPPSSQGPSLPSTPTPKDSSSTVVVPSPPYPKLINTPQQFLDHFTQLTLSTEHEQDSLYRDHLSEIAGLKERCDALIELLDDGEKEVKEMEKCLAYVEERSESLRGACEDLLEEQTHLLTHTSQLAHRLTFFTFLESATRMLNNPGNDLVLNPQFLPMVKRLDECLTYLGEHRDFKDAEVYLLRYQQCMTRSMALVKLYFVGVIKNLGQEVGRRLTDQSLSETATQAFIYTKFISLSATLRPLLAELEQRVISNPDELGSLLVECHTAYLTTRRNLMGQRVNAEIGRMDPGKSDLVDLARSGCSYLKQTCTDEFNLFKHFFLSGESQLYDFLESLCDYLYDHLRPRILHEPSLQVLCGVCTVLQALMVREVTDEEDEESTIFTPSSTPGSSHYPGGDDYFSSRPPMYRSGSSRNILHSRSQSIRRVSSYGSHRSRSVSSTALLSPSTRAAMIKSRKRKPFARLHIEVLLRMVLQDTQTRLVFRAQALLSADVEYYVPKEGDLDYPERLKLGLQGNKLVPRQLAVSLDAEDDDEPAILELPPAEAQKSWYPPLRVTLWVLSCLHTYVDAVVFEDLAQEAVTMCRRSLSSASDMLVAKKGKNKNMDAKMFLVRHLLILKEMTTGLELGKARRQEWSGLGDFLKSLLDNASSLLGYQRGTAQSNFVPDARTDIDRALKASCEDLISLVATRATSPLRTFLDKCTAYIAKSAASSSSAKTDLSAQEFATSEKVKEVHEQFKSVCTTEVEEWKKELRMYLLDEDTVAVLVPPAYNAIIDGYRQFHDLIRAEYDFITAAGIMRPSGVMDMLEAAS